jgi:hypothetical protein
MKTILLIRGIPVMSLFPTLEHLQFNRIKINIRNMTVPNLLLSMDPKVIDADALLNIPVKLNLVVSN